MVFVNMYFLKYEIIEKMWKLYLVFIYTHSKNFSKWKVFTGAEIFDFMTQENFKISLLENHIFERKEGK